MNFIQPIIALHGFYYLYMGWPYLRSFLSTKEIIYLYPSTSIIFGAILFFSAINLQDKKLIHYYSIIIVYCISIIIRTVSSINYLISNKFDSAVLIGLIVGNVLMAGFFYYVYKEKNKVIDMKDKPL
ncbi:hypothetical protein [Natronincola ferrireducens]|uniref:Uncharacterized protein n=1 Tax=Natronincola ferrireducens TaxID=393762 RepID=A0A1G9GYP5_9FIRM|nr:hypothetical protein [Natronincola ferrireducens]SDL05777.1 hypothetical protein SAMN05660472_02530 [Natronincola ferrireducens]